MKKLLASLSLSALLLVGVASAAFPDVGSDHANSVAINALVDQDILKGYDHGHFEPLWPVTRAEALKIILLGMGTELSEESVAAAVFSDVSEDDWFYPFVGTAVGDGIVNGYEDLTFRPHQTVTRAEAAKMVTLASGLPADALDPRIFSDVNSEDWFFGYANFMSAFNIEPGQTDGLWHPEEDMTRANMAEMVYRMQNHIETGEPFYEGSNWLRYGYPDADISILVPFGWQTQQSGLGAAWLSDIENGQLSLLEPMENGGTLIISVNENTEGMSKEDLFSQLESSSPYTTGEGFIGEQEIPVLIVYVNDDEIFREWYIYLESGKYLHLQALRGTGLYREYLEEYFGYMIGSIEYEPNASGLTVEEAVSAIRSAIQVDDLGESMMSLLDDLILIETDPIGVGTGPIDYFYSPSADITIKYERSLDVILDVRDGQSSAF